MIPADNVDAEGTTWATVVENIRNGEKNYSSNLLTKILSDIFGVEMQIVNVEVDMSGVNITTNVPSIKGTVSAIIPPHPFAIIGISYPQSSEDIPFTIYYKDAYKNYPAYIYLREPGNFLKNKLTLTLLMKKE